MYMNLKKSTAMIILASIVSTANISIFSGYATGSSGDGIQTELGGSNDLIVECSNLHKIKFSNELTYEEYDKLCIERELLIKEINEQNKKTIKSKQDMKRSGQKFIEISKNLLNSQQKINGVCKKLIEHDKKNKKIFQEEIRQFNLKCEELESQFKMTEEIINQLNENNFIYTSKQNTLHNLNKNKFELEAKYYNLCQFDEYNKNYKNFCDSMKEQSLCVINLFKIQCQRNKAYLDMEKKYCEFIKQLSLEEGKKPSLHQLDLNDLSVLKKLSQSKSNQQWAKILCEYINLKDKHTKLENTLNIIKYNVDNELLLLRQVQDNFEKEKERLINSILSKYKAEHSKPKIEVGASVTMEYNNKQCENNTSEEVKSVEKSDVEDLPKGTGQAKIDKSSDYNKEKKLRAKEEKRKNKKNSKRGTVKVKDINYPSETSQENSSVFVKAKIIRKEEAVNEKDVNLINNDGESTLSNLSEGSNDSSQSDSSSEEINTSVESSSTDSEVDSESIDNNNNLEMSDEELIKNLAEANKGLDEFIQNSVKSSASQSDDEFIKSLLGNTGN